MSESLRWALLALLTAVFVSWPVSSGWAQRRPSTVGAQSRANMNQINPNFYLPSGISVKQAAYNTATLGNAAAHIPPYLLGYNPYVHSVRVTPGISPYGGYDPYAIPGYGAYGYGYGLPYQTPAEGYLRGAADLTAATGQYWKDIQTARITREQARQASLDTKRKQLEMELEYEKHRVTAPKLRAAEQATDLEWARRDPPASEIWSGRSLNTLYRSILSSPRAVSGPTIPLEESVLRGINLNTKTSRGSTGLLKEGGKLAWPLPLQDSLYDQPRQRLSKDLEKVAADLEQDRTAPDQARLKSLQDDLTSLSALLDSQVKDLTPSDYIGSRRFLNQIKDTLQALADPSLMRSSSTRLPRSIRSVGELVGYMQKNGLEFAPAVAPGDEPAYTSLYYSLRSYEAQVAVAAR